MFVLNVKNTITEDLNTCIDDMNIKPHNSVKILGITLEAIR